MSEAQTVPMFAPDGTLGDIPAEKLMDAKKAGFKQGVTMKTADGKLGVIPADKVPAAAKSGLQIVPIQDQETQHPGFWASLGSDLKDMVKGAATTIGTALSSDPNDIAYRMNQQAQTARQMSENDDARKAEGRGVPYRVGAAANEALGVNVKGEEQSAKEGDAMGVLGHASAVPVTMAATAGAGKAAPIISDVAKVSAERASMAAERVGKITPKQAAQGAGAISGAVSGHGALSAPGAYYGAKTFGKIAESLLGKERANSPIFKGNADLPLDDMADALAQTIADDRARAELNKSKGLGELPATSAKPASQTGEALAAEPTPGPEPKGGKAATAPRFSQADRAAAVSLLQDALKQHSGDIIDAAIPPSGTTRGANLFTRTQVDAALKSGDVGQAEKVLDAAAKATNPSWTPLQRQVVPSVNEIRARVKAEKPGSPQDVLETRSIQETMREDLQKHGWAAESEARREFIARNSTGVTKGELTGQQPKPVKYTKTPGVSYKAFPAAGSASDDLTDLLQKSLEQARARQQGK